MQRTKQEPYQGTTPRREGLTAFLKEEEKGTTPIVAS
jgi:hypothetical protein